MTASRTATGGAATDVMNAPKQPDHLNRRVMPLSMLSTVRLAAVPKTGFKLGLAVNGVAVTSPSSVELDQLRNTLDIELTEVENIDDGTPCTIDFNVGFTGSRSTRELTFAGVILKNAAGRFEVKLEGNQPVVLDVIKHRLIGEGAVTLRVHPAIPHCNEGGNPEKTVGFDNRVKFTIDPDPEKTSVFMGTALALKPDDSNVTGAFSNKALRLTVEEYDAPPPDKNKIEVLSKKDLHRDFDWPAPAAAPRSPQTWRLGCEVLADPLTAPAGSSAATGSTPAAAGPASTPSTRIQLTYPEPNEVPPYEFAYTVSVHDGNDFVPLELDPVVFAKKVPKPRLSTLELKIDPAPAPASERPSPGDVVQARVKIENLANDVCFDVQLSLWRAELHEEEQRFVLVPDSDTKAVYDSSGTAELLRPLATVPDREGLFAVLRIPISTGAAGSRSAPVSTVLETGDRRIFEADMRSGSGIFASPLWGSSVCSSEASAKDFKPAKPLLDHPKVKQVMWQDDKRLRARLEAVLGGDAPPGLGTPSNNWNCGAGVARAIQLALVACGYSIAKDGGPVDDVYGKKTNKAFGKFILEYAAGDFSYLLVDGNYLTHDAPDTLEAFKKDPSTLTDAQFTSLLASLPTIPIRKEAFEVLLKAVSEIP